LFFTRTTRHFLAEPSLVQQVSDAQPAPRHLVFICRADAASSRADLCRAQRSFRCRIHLPVIRKNQVRAIAQVQAAGDVNPRLGQGVNFSDQRRGIDHNAWANHGVASFAQNPARNQLENESVAVKNDRVACIVSARAARDVVERPGKVVHHLAFPFIAPLRADHHDALR
jgi:hypothetical protein